MKRESGNILDVINSTIYPGTLEIKDGKIVNIVKDNKEYDIFLVPPLIDAHVHIESSMLVPSEFARIAVIHGTAATVSDPHEIANILGVEGINYMLENSKAVPFKFYFGAPSCVPATTFETAGAELDAEKVEGLLQRDDIKYLSEMMNFPGVISNDPMVKAKIELAKKYGKPVDGHAPGLRGKQLEKYIKAGITTDHETCEREEALEKLQLGMKILIRESSAAKNFDALIDLIEEYSDYCMFCSDDKHPDDLVKGHINGLVKRALDLGYDKMKVLKVASLNPVKHYGLDVGLLRKGDYADFIVIDNFKDFNILKTYINGQLVAEEGKTLLPKIPVGIINHFKVREKRDSDFMVKKGGEKIYVIQAIDGQLVTEKVQEAPLISDDYIVSDPERDILKLTVVNRYEDVPPAIAFIKNFGLNRGAIASSVSHDSHNIIAVGVSDKDIAKAVNLVIKNRGGLSIVYDDVEDVLPLPIAGLMTDEDGFRTAKRYSNLDKLTKGLGSNLRAPYMTLSFMALLVIPKLKLSDKGLFDGEKFEFINLIV
ncbi:MAG: adenine deaminase [Deltaproteobacteria bacterium]|nr:adenine deaminase [Deltaproteobacteria bacterium]